MVITKEWCVFVHVHVSVKWQSYFNGMSDMAEGV